RITGEHRAAVRTALRTDQPRARELAEHLGQISLWDPRAPGQLGNGGGGPTLAGQLDHEAKRVLRGLREHGRALTILDKRVQSSSETAPGPPRNSCACRELSGSGRGTRARRTETAQTRPGTGRSPPPSVFRPARLRGRRI